MVAELRERQIPVELSKKHELQGGSMLLINTRVWLQRLSEDAGRKITLSDVPKAEWERLSKSYDALYLLGIYKPSLASEENARQYLYQYTQALPHNSSKSDVKASPFATVGYEPHPDIAKNWREWDKVVDHEIHKRGMKVIIDFVPNHVGLDHPWVMEHPDYFIQSDQNQYNDELQRAHRERRVAVFDPREFTDKEGNTFHLARGKDPNFPAWTDTLQLNYANPKVQDAMAQEVAQLARHADGVRCDMAMLLNPSTFLQTWGHLLSGTERVFMEKSNFWKKATDKARRVKNGFVFMAEAYWDQNQLVKDGFDYTYAKGELYDKCESLVRGRGNPEWIANYLKFDPNLSHRINFTENHDEERALMKFGEAPSKAFSALLAFMGKGVWMVHQGQEEGSRIKIPMQISRTRRETPMTDLQAYYQRLHVWRRMVPFREGNRTIPPHFPADNEGSSRNIIVQQGDIKSKRMIACTNLSNNTSRSFVMVPPGAKIQVFDLMSGQSVKDIATPTESGHFFVELKPWSSQIVVCDN